MPRLLSVLCLFALPITAQPDATAVLSRVKQAMGGERWDDVRTLHLKGRIEIGELQGNYEAWFDLHRLLAYTDQHFSHPLLGDLRSTSGWNGSVSWTSDQTGDVCVARSLASRREAATDAYLEGFGYLLKASPPATVRAKGDASYRHQHFHVLLLTPPDANPLELWTDKATDRVTRLVSLSGVSRDVTTYSEFRTVEGLQLPFHIDDRDARSGKFSAITIIESIEVNRDPPPDLFDPPPSASGGLVFPPGQDSVSLPFLYEDGHIYLPVTINGRRLENFVFDTGMDNTIDTHTAMSLGLKPVKAGAAYGGGTEAAENSIARVDRIEVGGLKMENQIIDVTPLPHFGTPLDGGIGYEFAKRSIVTLDFALRRITFTRPEVFQPPAGAAMVPIRFSSLTEIVADGSVNGSPGEFQLDTGQDISLLLDRPFAERTGLLRSYGSGRKSAVSGVGGKASTTVFQPDRFELGGLQPMVSDAGIMLSKTGGGAEEYLAGTVGNRIFRQYRVTLDYAHEKAYFEKNPSYKPGKEETLAIVPHKTRKPSDGSLGLIRFGRQAGGPLQIFDLTANGAAARAGIEKGDWILAVNGSPVETLNLEQLFSPMLARPGSAVRLTIRHGDSTREVTLTTE